MVGKILSIRQNRVRVITFLKIVFISTPIALLKFLKELLPMPVPSKTLQIYAIIVKAVPKKLWRKRNKANVKLL